LTHQLSCRLFSLHRLHTFIIIDRIRCSFNTPNPRLYPHSLPSSLTQPCPATVAAPSASNPPTGSKNGSPCPCRMGAPHPAPALSLLALTPLSDSHVNVSPARHVAGRRRPAPHAHPPAPAPALEAQACDRGGRAS
jgi:hypothetical protein